MVQHQAAHQHRQGSQAQNSAPIKYHIEIANSFWNNIFKVEGITDRVEQQKHVNQEKDNIINFLTGMENSGKVLFSTFYVSPNGEEQHDVVINKIETDKEGGDWATDIIKAVNMMCFTMRVHSNLVGSGNRLSSSPCRRSRNAR